MLLSSGQATAVSRLRGRYLHRRASPRIVGRGAECRRRMGSEPTGDLSLDEERKTEWRETVRAATTQEAGGATRISHRAWKPGQVRACVPASASSLSAQPSSFLLITRPGAAAQPARGAGRRVRYNSLAQDTNQHRSRRSGLWVPRHSISSTLQVLVHTSRSVSWRRQLF